jgi:hypothetical protein
MDSPLTPPDCDLRGMEWMPFYGGRLFYSDFDAHATDAEWRAGVKLWWASWNQVPAASLPDDDVALCRLAGLGKDMKTWRKVKARALHGFVKCSDGRIYHKALAAFALESWRRRLKDRERKAKYRARRDGQDADVPRTERGRGAGQNGPGDVLGTADRTRCDATGRDATLKHEAAADARAPEAQAFDAWNEFAKTNAAPCADFLTSSRIFSIKAVLAAVGGVEAWRRGLEKAGDAKFLRGADDRFHGWFKLDWLLRDDHFAKLLEGEYDQPRGQVARGAPSGESFDQRRIREAREAVRDA